MSSYNGTLTATLPGVIDGNYHLIVVADSKLQEPDLNRANNTAASTPLRVTPRPSRWEPP